MIVGGDGPSAEGFTAKFPQSEDVGEEEIGKNSTPVVMLGHGETWLLGRRNLVVGSRALKSTTSYQDLKVKKELF